MKKLLLSLMFLSVGASQAETITLNDTLCGTGQTAICSSPAKSVSELTWNPAYGRLAITINGTQYVSAPNSASSDGGTVYANDGTWREVATMWVSWVTTVRSGRTTARVTHYELKGGSVH